MRLCENAVYIRFATRVDMLDAGGHLVLVNALESLTGARFGSFRDLAATRARALSLDGSRAELLDAHVGAGFHQQVRFRLDAEGEALRSLELNAGLHPYSGVYLVQVDARLGSAFVEEHSSAVAALVADWVERFQPLTLQCHDVDDDAVQNIDSPRLAELGYGRTVPEDPADRPGREAVRGQFRLVPTWISYVGPDALELLGEPELHSVEASDVQRVADGLLVRLADGPVISDQAAYRERQSKLRDALGIDALIERDRRTYSYWKRKR